jgi:glycosyltransferase involved in cell wall biosynthesis
MRRTLPETIRIVPKYDVANDAEQGPRYGEGDEMKRVAFVSTYLPRQCGIATFTSALNGALRANDPNLDSFVVALNEPGKQYSYSKDVRYQLSAASLSSYRRAAEFVNTSGADVVSLQHEYGIFGGKDGDQILTFLRLVKVPVVTTLHTVLPNPSSSQRAVMEAVCALSKRVVVMSESGAQLLHSVHEVPDDKIDFIPHGIQALASGTGDKRQLGLAGKQVLLTFGLLSPDKGIETVIDALPQVVAKHPGVVYVILGATHPHVKEREGETYRFMLEARARQRGVHEHVVFHDAFVSETELAQFLSATDIYITPYLNLEQSSSGTLAYAVGSGKVVISSAFRYARELLANGRGVLVPPRNSAALATAIVDVLNDPARKAEIEQRASGLGASMNWSNVASRYVASFESGRLQREPEATLFLLRPPRHEAVVVPDVDMSHMLVLTDDTGILQHAVRNVPRYAEGYCTDDNARALLLVSLMEEERVEPPAKLRTLATRYLGFLNYAFNAANGKFRNFLSYDRVWMEQAGSDDSHGRALWALGTAIHHTTDPGRRELAKDLFAQALPGALSMSSPRAWAYALIGIHEWLQANGEHDQVKGAGQALAKRLMTRYVESATPDWSWFEREVTYCNARLPQALILAASFLDDEQMLDTGLQSLQWLHSIQEVDGRYSPIGSSGFYVYGGEPAVFDQQPVEACGMVSACLLAYRVTADDVWAARAQQAFDWFLGRNCAEQWLYDPMTGGCRDGLNELGVNENQGAEATLSFLLALMDVRQRERHASWRGVLARRTPLKRVPLGEA